MPGSGLVNGGLVIGLGGSAGALEALESFFSNLPADSGLSFVIVQHLERHHPSMLPELLGQKSRMPVLQAQAGARVEPDHVYVIAPNTLLTIDRGVLRVSPAAEAGPQATIDAFLRSLAEDQGEGAVGIILSGTGSDGAAGLRAIRENGGLTLAQAPETARHDGMPRAVIESGLVDHVLPVEKMPAVLLSHALHVAPRAGNGGRHESSASTEGLDAQLVSSLGAICSILRKRTGHDFGRYKEGTLLRRIRRRLLIQHISSVAEYLQLLERESGEVSSLLKDLLIGVTQFFRDPSTFALLEERIVPALIEGKDAGVPVRIWVPGCASGEEAYSIAILVRERLDRLHTRCLVQIFATDIDGEMLAEARRGRYPERIAEQVSRERLERFFAREGTTYQANKELREMCIFSMHSLIRDPPFSSLDLISCRNLLIYLEADLQKKLVPLFHYALRSRGYLLLGPSEGLAAHSDLFETVDKKHRIFRRRDTVLRPIVDFPFSRHGYSLASNAAPSKEARLPTPQQKARAAYERMLLDDYTPPSAVVNERGDVIFLGGRIGQYLQPPAGTLITNLLDVVRGTLRVEVLAALHAATRTQRKVVRDNVPFEMEEGVRHLRLTVRPVAGLERGAGLYAVVLQERAPVEEAEGDELVVSSPEPALEQLETELRTTRADLKFAVEEAEAANEELKSSNEELISTNEELQSANEELQTSKEELQSLNEELETVNAELEQKVEELGAANSDLQNLFASTEIATIFLDRDLKVARFTPAVTALFRLLESDVGRPIDDFAPRFVGQDVVADAREVLRSLTPIERQVGAAEGASWFILRVAPYRTVENVIAGVVVTFVDISQLKRSEEALRASEERFRLLVEDVKDYAIFMLAPDGSVASWNVGAERLKGYRAEEIIGEDFSRFYLPEDVRAGKPRRELEVATAEGRLELEGWRVRKDGSRFWADIVLSAIRDQAGNLRGFGKVTRDFTERKRAEEALHESEERLRRAQEIAHLGSWELDLAQDQLSWSDEVYRIFGLQPREFVATYEAFLEAVHPEDRAAVSAAYSGSLREGRDSYEIEHRVIRKAGGDIRVVHEKCEHVRDAAGRIVRSIGMVHDITDRKRDEEALLRSREGLRLLAEASLRVVRQADLEGMLQAISEAALTLTGARSATCGHGYVNGQFIIGGAARAPGAPACPPGKMFVMEKGGVHMDLVEGADAIRLTDAEMRAHPRWWGLPDEHVPMRGLLGVRLLGRQGQTSGMLLVTDKEQGDFTAEDESLLRQLATLASLASQHVEVRISLEESDRQKNHFLAMLSHELRNPLAPIRNSLYILERAAPGGEQARRAQTVIDRQVVHLMHLVDDLLDVTRISRGKVQLQRERLELRDLVHRAVEDNRWEFARNGIELQLDLPAVPLWIDGDRTRIVQVIGNLLHNSAKFTQAGGKATVSVEANVDLRHAIVRVRDTGVGIAPELLPRVFEPFSQADTTLDRSKGGLGLGLALVKGLVEMHGGTASVESDGLDRGAQFTVRFPLETAELPAAPARVVIAPSPPRRILVIEDNVDAADSLREVLELGEHMVEVAYSGPAGIERAREFLPDVVLCDIGLPDMDGYQVARAMRANPALRETTLVALTGYAAPEDITRSREAGFDSHLAKPPSLEKIEEAIAPRPGARHSPGEP
jgi:two-component system CheB/CheR fusion protein